MVIRVGQHDADIIGKDHRALQAAVDYVGQLGGGVVEIGPGTYTMGDSLHLRSRVTVRGAGDQTILKKECEYRSALSADGDYGEAAVTLEDPTGFGRAVGFTWPPEPNAISTGVCDDPQWKGRLFDSDPPHEC